MTPIRFEWSASISVGNSELDAQHQMLFKKTNDLLDIALKEPPTMDGLAEILAFLENYTEEHFTFEEHYMKLHGYPEIERHHALHENFKKEFTVLREKIHPGSKDTFPILELESFLGRWLTEHIGTEDKKYALYIGS